MDRTLPFNVAFHLEAIELPALPGAYILLIETASDIPVRISSRSAAVLPEGRYLYCGSAKGPGGIKARVARHMCAEKAVRWHVDQLTVAGRVVGAWAFPGGDECDLTARLSALPVPIPGFGSTDCRRCESHLLICPEGWRPER